MTEDMPGIFRPVQRSSLGLWLGAFLLMLLSARSALGQPTATAPGPSAKPAQASAKQPAANDEKHRQETPKPPGSAASEAPVASVKPPAVTRPEVSQLVKLTANIRAFARGDLPLDVDPASLFETPLGDEAAVRVERERLKRVVGPEATASSSPMPASSSGEAKPSPVPTASKATPPVTSAAPGPNTAASTSPPGETVGSGVDKELWQAHLELDRARLEVYALTRAERLELLAKHERRLTDQVPGEQSKALTEAEQRARTADRARLEALQAARRARSEAARLVVEERARLLGVAKQQAEFEAKLLKENASVAARQENLLKLERRVREALEAMRAGSKSERAADALHRTVEAALSEARSAWAVALSAFISTSNSVPEPGDDRLGDVPPEIDTSSVQSTRAELEEAALQLKEKENDLQEARVRQLHDEVVSLNQRRLELLPHLSTARHTEVTGLNTTGLGEALGEAEQVALVVQYHLGATMRWLAAIQRPGSKRDSSAVAASVVALKWLLPLAVFVWWRRRADRVLSNWLGELENARSRSTTGPGVAERLLQYVRRVRSPVEWLLLMSAMLGLLPPQASSLLEVELVRTIFGWTLGGAIVVHTIDFLADAKAFSHTRRSMLYSGHLRLRSLRLAGRVVVTLGLVLALTNLLVGKGTIYGWVLNFCWLAGVAVLLIILRWWRNIIFERVDYKRKKSRVETWVVNNRRGVASFPAAVAGATLLLSHGVVRFAKAWVTGFDLTRRVLAYLFRREIKKKADDQAKIAFQRIPNDLYQKLGPHTPSHEVVPSVADAQVVEVIARINAPGGGVFAVVGERGAGKSTLMQRIATDAPGVKLVDCPFGGMRAFAPRLLEVLGAEPTAQLEQAALDFDATDVNGGILIDNAHRLIQPAMGGLKNFDRVVEIARNHSRNAAWVFAFDSIIWQFFERMRGSRPLFDTVIRLVPWTDSGIANLISARTTHVDVTPDFSRLLGELPPDADEVDVQEALDRTENGYYRLIWDYADGNPGVALTVWRGSLGVDPDGSLCVRVFRAPDPEELEGLPDSAKFVLRAVVQLERATPESIGLATGLGLREVHDALRFGSARGYFDQNQEGFAVTWQWFRAITRYLARHHLLVPALGEES